MAETAGVGRVVWHELQSQDVGRSRIFYEELFGWRVEAPASTGEPALLRAQAVAIGAMTRLPAPFGPTRWIAYVSVADTRASAARAEALGCRLIGSTEADGQRAAIVEDPLGARFGLLEGERAGAGPVGPGTAAEGCFCWDQLYTRSAARSFALYSELFGWSREPDAQVPAWSWLRIGEAQAAGLMQATSEVSARWLSCVRVDDLEAACARAHRLGGQVLLTPTPTTAGVGMFAVLRDPLGAQIGACAWSSPPT